MNSESVLMGSLAGVSTMLPERVSTAVGAGYPSKLPSYIDPEVFAAFLESRKAHKAPFTPRCEKLLITKIMRHHSEGWDVNEALEAAAISGWKSIYPQVKRHGYDLEKERAAERAARDKAGINASIEAMCKDAVKIVN